LKVIPLFDGLRSDPSQKGQIQNISFDNFTPRHLIYYTLWGLAELFRSKLESDHLRQIQYIVGSGNAIKKNKLFQSILSQVFNKKIDFPPFDEEAATGAALNALMALKELMPSK
ncbi:MAG: FGGY-family carbohydrate kinase, partial [Bacteroidota bacterium]